MEPLSSGEYMLLLRYLDKEMTKEEQAAFEAALEKSAPLREALATEENLMNTGLSAAEKMKRYTDSEKKNTDEVLQNRIKMARAAWEEEYEPLATENHPLIQPAEARTRRMLLSRSWLVAASIVGVLVLGVAMYMLSLKNQDKIASLSKAERQALCTQLFKLDPPPENASPRLQPAFNDIKVGEFEAAIEYLKNVDPGMDTRGVEEDKKLTVFYVFYFTGLSYMADSNFVQAISPLDSAAANSTDGFLKAKTQWYLALAYLYTGELKRSELLLQQVAGSNKAAAYKQEAISLLGKLKE